MNFPSNLKYTKEHIWVHTEGDIATAGITDFAQQQLGDIVYVDVETIGDTFNQDEVFGSIEAVKTVSDLFMPLTGEIVAFNEALNQKPEKVNTSPYEEGWIIQLKISDAKQLDNLLSAEAYKNLIDA
ncbi:glycine cleavage system H protein [Capnocytophaga sp. HP1101]